MARLLIQSQRTGMFLVQCPISQEPIWERNLGRAGSGVLDDMAYVAQLINDWTRPEDLPMVVDLDNLICLGDDY